MKEIIESIKKEIVEVKTTYEAADGTIFDSKEECSIYEKSAIGVLMAKVNAFSIANVDDTEWLDIGEENQYKTLVPKTQKDIDAINQLYFIFGGKCSRDPKFTKSNIGDIILMGYRIEGNTVEWVWFYSFADIVKDVTNDTYELTKK